MRRALAIGLLSFAACAAISANDRPVQADEPAIDVPAAERSFAVGDLASRPGAEVERTDDVARALAWLYDVYWRPGSASADPIVRRPEGVATAYAAALTAYAAASADAPPPEIANDPFPVVSALVLDRIRRERDGLHSTRSSGPLSAVASKLDDIGRFLDHWSPQAYGGPAADPDRNLDEEKAHVAEVRDAAHRSRSIALGAVASLVGLAVLAAWILGRRWGTAPSSGPSNPTDGTASDSSFATRSGS